MPDNMKNDAMWKGLGDAVPDNAPTPMAEPDGMAEVPVSAAPDPDPKPLRPPVPKAQGKAFFRSQLDRQFPTAHRIKFWKRGEDGTLRAIPRPYTARDLQRSHDIEEFVSTYLVPTYGDGDYEVAILHDDGKVSGTQSVSILSPTPPQAQPSGDSARIAGITDRIMDRMTTLEERLFKAQEHDPAPAPKSLLEQMEEFEKMKRQFSSGEGLMPMLLMQMMNQQRAPQGPSPDVGDLRRELREVREALADLKNVAPPPPALPPSGPETGVSELLGQVIDAMRPQQQPQGLTADDVARIVRAEIGANAPQEDPLERLIKLREAFKDDSANERLRDITEELRTLRAERAVPVAPGGGLKDSLETIDLITQRFGGGGGESTGDKVLKGIEMVLDPERIRALADVWKSVASGMAPSKEPPRDSKKQITYPAGFGKFTKAITAATNDQEILFASMAALEFLGKHTAWQPHVWAMGIACKNGERAKALAFSKSFVEGLRGAKRIDTATARRAADVFEANIDDVIATVAAAMNGSPAPDVAGDAEAEG